MTLPQCPRCASVRITSLNTGRKAGGAIGTLAGAATVFCTSRSQFAILGNDNCESRRYRPEKFMETAPPEDGKLVYQFFDSAFTAPKAP